MTHIRVMLACAVVLAGALDAWGQEYTPQCRNATTGKLQDCAGRLRRSQAPLFDVQRFTTPGAITWIKPVGAYQRCTLRCCGGGGGGGSGSRRPAPGGGGAAGSGGGCSERQYAYSDLVAASYAGLVGAGGSGDDTARRQPASASAKTCDLRPCIVPGF